ncbi:MAG: efflux transporter outer membrane subunit [Rhodocyclales bacterium GT-UBC]|nr:MAG: efflux transporter outer membrane subunit [Rhodocyclales bacterium GT-UBC]
MSSRIEIIPRPGFSWRTRSAFLLSLALAGCAALPSSFELPVVRDAAQYRSADVLAAPEQSWPDEQWWRRYGDAQLDALIEEGLARSPDMAVAAARLRNAEAARQISNSALYPQVSGNASATSQKQSYNYLTPRNMTPDGWQDYGRASLDFSWEIDFWGKNRAALAAATSEALASQAELAQARLTLATGIATDYAELAHLFATRDTLAEALRVRSRTAELFAQRFANGLETRGSLREAEARRAAAEGDLLQVDEQIALQRNRLAALLGAGPDRGHDIARPQFSFTHHYALPAELAVDLLGRRPDIVAARLQVEAQGKRIEEKRAGFYPNVNLAAFIGVQSLGLNMLHKGGSNIGSVGPAISLPIFNAGRLQGELRGAQARYAEAVASYDKTVTQALQDVADAAVSQKALGARLSKSEEAVGAASEAYQVARNRYEGGLSSYLEVLSAEDGLLTNLRALTDLRSRSFTLDVALTRALGGGYRTNN